MGNNRENYIKGILSMLTRTYPEDSAQAKSLKSGLKKLNTNQLDSLFIMVLSVTH